MSALVSLALGPNGFTGSIPSSWGSNLPSLQVLGFEVLPGITRQLPVRFANLPGLTNVWFARCNFSGTIPREWGDGMRSLRVMDYHDNPGLGGCLPPQFRDRNVTDYWGKPLDSPTTRSNTQVMGFCPCEETR